MTHLLQFAANDIDIAGLAREAELPLAWLDQELAETEAKATSPGHVSFRLSLSGTEVVVRGAVAASVELPCARCTEASRYDIAAELSLLLRPGPKETPVAAPRAADAAAKRKPRGSKPDPASVPAAKRPAKTREAEREFDALDAETDTYDGETVILDGFVREAILLELPNFPLCSDACPGIRPASAEAGAVEEQATDPRLSGLKGLSQPLKTDALVALSDESAHCRHSAPAFLEEEGAHRGRPQEENHPQQEQNAPRQSRQGDAGTACFLR